MHALLLGVTAIAAAVPAPALAQESGGSEFVATHGPGVYRDFRRGGSDRFDRRRLRGTSDTVFVYDRDWEGDSAWRSNSFNDWWHERPDRSMPRWVRNNQNCERMWWSGGGWRC